MRSRFAPRTAFCALLALGWHGAAAVECARAQEPQAPAAPLQAVPAQAAVPAVPAIPAMRLVPAMRALPRNPGATTGLPFDLANLVLAKFDASPKGTQLLALVEQTRTEQREVTVTRLQQEKRTRTILVGPKGDQQEVEQEYTVSIPITETIQSPVQVPAGKKPTAFPLDGLRVYRLDGTQVADADVPILLAKMTPVFLLRGFDGKIPPVEGVFLQALNPNCLIVVTEQAAQ